MGLCKCPKRRITNQFCYEHRVNVCEYCIVTNHSKCIVLSYLQWLQDGDYNPVCELCQTQLIDGECIRLVCYHVFHWNCINDLCSKLSPTAESSKYVCPTCNGLIFPSPNDVSPVAEALRRKIENVTWGKAPIPSQNTPAKITEQEETRPPSPSPQLKSTINHNSVTRNTHENIRHNDATIAVEEPLITFGRTDAYSHGPRRLIHAADTEPLLKNALDHDENKYKRRTPSERINQWRMLSVNTHYTNNNAVKKRLIVFAAIVLVAIITILLYLFSSSSSSDYDPFFDPMKNPNIKVEDTE